MFSFILFNRGILGRGNTDSAKPNILTIIGSILVGIALSITLIGILFAVMHWPGSKPLFIVGLSALLLLVIAGIISYYSSPSYFHLEAFKRVAIIGLVGLTLNLLPPDFFLEFKYRNHPELLKALKAYHDSPSNQALRKKVDEERARADRER